MRDMNGLEWFKSSYSGNDGPECVEVALTPDHIHIHIRDSKTTGGDQLTVSADTWTSFLSHAGHLV
ncbi:uncharacterized protein DUF397 [Streptomyces sp. BK022]|uniref:DUF397 domain-containing protein n=1 Tax=Streptomyces sp. BK022 TaxID=2512123 RepID=UPI001029CCE3|nr:DUF397 domain-containing protein [Streptomyces sp. BK022]RZU29311.1 uncharacterized protein DUF397 [Streptomyces sp. BK022]